MSISSPTSSYYSSSSGDNAASSQSSSFSSSAFYVLRNLRAGAVYDVLVKARNGYGWSDWSAIFNLFKKGVGELGYKVTN